MISPVEWMAAGFTSWQPMIEWAARMTVIAALGLAVLAAARRASAATRHGIAIATLGLVIAVPAATVLLPSWAVPVLPARIPAGPVWNGPTYLAWAPSAAVAPVETRNDAPEAGGARGAGTAAVAEAAPALPPPARAPIPWPAFALVAWAAGAVVLLLRLAVSTSWAAGIAWRAVAVTREPLVAEFERARRRLGIGAPVVLRQSGEVSVPVVLCLARPTLVLPLAAERWSVEKARVVLLHELAHVRRRDPLWLTATCLVTAVGWFHPLVWVLGGIARRECERACDDVVLSNGVRASDYAEHLLSIVRSMMVEADRLPRTALTFAMSSNLERRLSSILEPGTLRGALSRTRALAIVAAGALLLVPIASVRLVAAPARPSPDAVAAARAEAEAEAAAAMEDARREVPLVEAAPVMESPSAADAGEPAEDARTETLLAEQRWTAGTSDAPRAGRELYAIAKDHYDAREYEDAGAAYYQAAKKGYRIGTAYYNAACSFALAGHETWALGALKLALDSGFDRPELVGSDDDLDAIRDDDRFQALLQRAMRSNSAVTKRQAAAAKYEVMRSTGADDAGEWKSVGLELLRLGEYDKAAAAFEHQFEVDQSGNALYNLACAHARAGRREPALKALERAIEAGAVDAKHMAADHDLASLRQDRTFRALVTMADDLALYGGGLDDEDADGWRRVVPRFVRMAEQRPHLGRAWFNLGFAELRAENPRASIAAFERALKLEHRPATSMYNLACAHAQAGDREQAIEWLERSEEAGMKMDLAATDRDLDPIRSDPRLKRILDRWNVRAAAAKHESKKKH